MSAGEFVWRYDSHFAGGSYEIMLLPVDESDWVILSWTKLHSEQITADSNAVSVGAGVAELSGCFNLSDAEQQINCPAVWI